MINMKHSNYIWLFIAVLFVVLGLQSCGIIEPEDAQELANKPPETVITSGPVEKSVVTYFVRIAWKGADSDGLVRSYQLAIDNQNSWRSTTKTDSTFHFEADTAAVHTIWVAAVDDRGAIDPTPASLTFTATNIAPDTRITLENDPPEGATFGLGQDFTIVATDLDNGPEFQYQYKIDNGQWSQWLNHPMVSFYEGSPFGLLPVGEHTFYARVKDAGNAVDPTPASFRFVASTNVKPVAVLQSTINALSFYEDNSAFFYKDSNNVRFRWSVNASAYYGRFAAAKFKLDSNPETPYLSFTDTLFANLTPGAHQFVLTVKDAGGVESAPITFNFNMAQASLNAGVLVVDDGDGRFAKEADADNFYNNTLKAAGVTPTLWDIKTQGNPTPGKGIGNYSTVIWEADESFMVNLPKQLRLAQEYLGLGGNLWISGWKPVQQIAATTPVTSFDPEQPNVTASYAFIWNYLKLAATRQSPGTPADFIGATGLANHPTLNVDPAKNFVPAFGNKLSLIDVFTLRSGVDKTTAIYGFVSNAGNPDFQGQIVGAKYLGADFKTVILGFPLYFMNNSEAVEAAKVILKDFGEI